MRMLQQVPKLHIIEAAVDAPSMGTSFTSDMLPFATPLSKPDHRGTDAQRCTVEWCSFWPFLGLVWDFEAPGCFEKYFRGDSPVWRGVRGTDRLKDED